MGVPVPFEALGRPLEVARGAQAFIGAEWRDEDATLSSFVCLVVFAEWYE
jgi:hypothetical protein